LGDVDIPFLFVRQVVGLEILEMLTTGLLVNINMEQDGSVDGVLEYMSDGAVISYEYERITATQTVVDPDLNNAMVGDVISLTFTADEDLNFVSGTTPLVTFESGDSPVENQVSYSQTNSTTYVASYTKHNDDSEGNISFNIVFEDLAGNENTYYAGQLDDSRIRFDKTSVVLNSLTVSSNNSTNTDYAKIGDVITYTVKTNHRIQSPELTFNSAVIPTRTRIATGTEWNSPDEWTLTHTVSSSDPSGALDLSLDLFDLAGNKYTVNQSNITGLNVKIQHDIPTITALGSGELKGRYFFDDNSNSYTLVELQTWDPGATGHDMVEGELTVTKRYSFDKKGNWRIIYLLTNSSGLKARKIIRLKNVPGANRFVWAWRN